MDYRLYKMGLVGILEIPDGFTGPQQITKMRNAVRKELVDGTNKLIVDLGRCTYVNSMLVGALVEMYTSFTNISGHILYVAPQPEVQRLFHIMKLDEVFEIVENVDTAQALLERRHVRASA